MILIILVSKTTDFFNEFFELVFWNGATAIVVEFIEAFLETGVAAKLLDVRVLSVSVFDESNIDEPLHFFSIQNVVIAVVVVAPDFWNDIVDDVLFFIF